MGAASTVDRLSEPLITGSSRGSRISAFSSDGESRSIKRKFRSTQCKPNFRSGHSDSEITVAAIAVVEAFAVQAAKWIKGVYVLLSDTK